MNLTKEEALDLLDQQYGGPFEPIQGLSFVAVQDEDTDRWSSVHTLIAQDANGDLWGATYSRGLTENQDESPWEYENEVQFHAYKVVQTIAYERDDES